MSVIIGAGMVLDNGVVRKTRKTDKQKAIYLGGNVKDFTFKNWSMRISKHDYLDSFFDVSIEAPNKTITLTHEGNLLSVSFSVTDRPEVMKSRLGSISAEYEIYTLMPGFTPIRYKNTILQQSYRVFKVGYLTLLLDKDFNICGVAIRDKQGAEMGMVTIIDIIWSNDKYLLSQLLMRHNQPDSLIAV